MQAYASMYLVHECSNFSGILLSSVVSGKTSFEVYYAAGPISPLHFCTQAFISYHLTDNVF